MKFRIFTITLLLIFFLGISVYGDCAEKRVPDHRDLYSDKVDEVTERLSAAGLEFAFDLFAKLAVENGEKNLFISPLSINMALYMTYNGSQSETAQAMSDVLKLGDINLKKLNEANKNLIISLKDIDKENIEISTANSLWYREDFEFNEDFMERCKDFYKGEVNKGLDIAVINNWVSKKTDGNIEKIVNKIEPDTILILLNALYFQGNWSFPFPEQLTQQGFFYLPDGTKKEVTLMTRSGKFDYYEGEDLQAINLPYGNGRVSMYIFLPGKDTKYQDFQMCLTEKNLNEWIDKLQMTELTFIIPRFKIEYEAKLNEPLEDMGMGIAFGGNADFSNMCKDGVGLFISDVIHKTSLEVNEYGTEASAATAVVIGRSMTPPVCLEVNRPFFCCIRDNETGLILFMGSICNPEKAGSNSES